MTTRVAADQAQLVQKMQHDQMQSLPKNRDKREQAENGESKAETRRGGKSM